MKVPFQEQLFLKTFKTKMRVYAAVKYVKLFTASALKRSAVLLVAEHLDWRNKKIVQAIPMYVQIPVLWDSDMYI